MYTNTPQPDVHWWQRSWFTGNCRYCGGCLWHGFYCRHSPMMRREAAEQKARVKFEKDGLDV